MEEEKGTGTSGANTESEKIQYDSGPINFWRIALSGLIAIAILAAGVGAMKGLASLRKPPPKKPVEPRTLKVQADDVTTGPYTVTVSAQGVVQARTNVRIVPEVSGKLEYVHPAFRDGGAIDKGAVLFRIEQDDYIQAVNKAKAGIESYQAEIAYQEDRRETLEKELELAVRTWEINREESERIRRLYERNASSEAELNRTLLTEQQAKQAVEQYKSSIDMIAPGISRIEAQLESARAALASAQLALERTEYRMPFRGRVDCAADPAPGQFAAAGQPLCTVQDVSALEIPAPVSMSDWYALAPEMNAEELGESPLPAEVAWRDDNGNRYTWRGRAVRMSSDLDHRTRMVDLIVEVSNGGGEKKLKPGMFVEVEFTGRELSGVATIPRRALRDGDVVYLAGEEGLEIRPVEVWRRFGERVVILGGLADGESVITSVVEEAAAGMNVAVISRNGHKISAGANDGKESMVD